ncbi:MBL fold metallo-hydrolase [Marinicauda salina]|uniref:MBL fold metallo-hydrolase n=1 Tax=Marinicauda salina TaxID=2135793 RepID=A0A2U2BTQ1_9PROT|nr:MBL fold metallo-hydrolase [Marinicauda salina]PWE17386.1 MBL fold metallo-hydrolase [Marinicauda salina]
MSREPSIQAFFDEPTNTVSYLVWDPETADAAVIDPVLDYDPASGKASADSAQAILDAAEKQGLSIQWVLETHAHADHLSGAPYIKEKTGAPVGIGERISEVQTIFRPVFGADDVSGEGAEFDRLFKDGETFEIGGLEAEVIATPGHTPACISYKIGSNVFVGDTLFMPDFGTARADFPGGDARTLFRSIQKLLSLPGETKLFMCHDYKTDTRDSYAWETTVAEERENNIHVHEGVTEEAFVKMRETRDSTLSAPKLLLPSIQTNIRAGALPPADGEGRRFLRIPVTLVDG